jgi:hypothetical protein
MTAGPHVTRWGKGEPIVCVHGSFGWGEETFQKQRELADAYELLLIDRRGYGVVHGTWDVAPPSARKISATALHAISTSSSGASARRAQSSPGPCITHSSSARPSTTGCGSSCGPHVRARWGIATRPKRPDKATLTPSLAKDGLTCAPAWATAIALLQGLSDQMAAIGSVDRALRYVARRHACPRVPASPKMYPSRTREASKSRHCRQQ